MKILNLLIRNTVLVSRMMEQTSLCLSFSVLAGRHLKHFLEFPAKITDIFKPGVAGNGGDAVLRRHEQFCCPFQPVMHQIADRRGVNIFVKNTKYTAFTEGHRFRDIVKRYLVRIIFVNVLP